MRKEHIFVILAASELRVMFRTCKSISEDNQEMLQSRSTALPGHQKKER